MSQENVEFLEGLFAVPPGCGSSDRIDLTPGALDESVATHRPRAEVASREHMFP
jgi:hypothetical protein